MESSASIPKKIHVNASYSELHIYMSKKNQDNFINSIIQEIMTWSKNQEFTYTCARSFPVTTAMEAERYWQRTADKLKTDMGMIRSYPKRAPPSIDATHFPGSIYVIAMKSTGKTAGNSLCRTLDLGFEIRASVSISETFVTKIKL